MTDMKPTTIHSSDTTDLVKLTSERFAEDWRIWRAGWEQWLTRPFGWLAAVSVNWLDQNPREYAGVPGLWWHDEDAAFVDPPMASVGIRRIDPAERIDEPLRFVKVRMSHGHSCRGSDAGRRCASTGGRRIV